MFPRVLGKNVAKVSYFQVLKWLFKLTPNIVNYVFEFI